MSIRFSLYVVAVLAGLGLYSCLVEALLCDHSLEFGETYVFQINISSPRSTCYDLSSSNEKEALRVYADSDEALVQHPVLVTVRQPRGVTSWPIPFVESGYAYSSVLRMLCPLLNTDDVPGESSLLVDMSTSSTTSVNLTLRVSIVRPYKLRLNRPEVLVASPSSPSYMLFEYPPDLTRVKVRLTSTEDTRHICAIASIQSVYCPVVELLDNPDDRGKYQTMRSIAAFNAGKFDRGFCFFYVVLSVFPNNGRHDNCDYTGSVFQETISLDDNYNPKFYTGPLRVKHVNVTIVPALSDFGYLLAVGLAAVLLLTFYIVACAWITVFDWWRYDLHPVYSALKRQASVILEQAAALPDDFDEFDGKKGMKQSGPPMPTTLSDCLDPTSNGVEDGDKQSGPPRPTAMSDCLDPTGDGDKPRMRPTLWSVLAGVHWKRLTHPPRPTTLSDSLDPTCNGVEDGDKPSVRPTLLSVLAGVHWKNMAREASALPKAPSRKHTKSQRSGSLPSPPSSLQCTTPLAFSSPQAGNVSGMRHRNVAGGPPSIYPLTSPSTDRVTSPTPSPLTRPSLGLYKSDSQSTIPDVGGEEVVSGEDDSSEGVSDEENEDEFLEMEYKHDTPLFPVNVLVSELGELDEQQKSFDYYSIYLFVVGTFYALPAYELVATFGWLTATGNEDICYHNHLCSQPLEVFGVTLRAFNNLFSNIAFFTLGLLLIMITYRRRQLYQCYVEMNLRRPCCRRIGIPQQFGIYYAMGMAMMAQALMSLAYHVSHQKNPDKRAGLHEIMLLLTGLVATVVIGMMKWTSVIFWLIFFIVYMFVTLLFVVEIYYRWQITNIDHVKNLVSFYWSKGIFPPRHKPKFVLGVVSFLINFGFAFTGLVVWPSKFGSYILYILLTNFIMYLVYYVITKVVLGEIHYKSPPKAVLFAVLSVFCWVTGVLFYVLVPIDWDVSPALSRDINRDCVFLSFYDSHDIWHFMSGFAVFFSAMLLMTLDDKQDVSTRDQLMTF